MACWLWLDYKDVGWHAVNDVWSVEWMLECSWGGRGSTWETIYKACTQCKLIQVKTAAQETSTVWTMDNEQIQFRQRSQVISSRSCRHPNPQPATNTLDSSTTNEERRKPRGSKIVSLSSSASSQGVSPRADSVTFCSCGSSLRFKSVGSGGGNCVSHHEGAASPTLELCRYEDTDGSSISTLSEERREPRGRETAALSSSAGGQGEIPTAERVRAASNSSSCPRADRADSFICPRCGSISSVTTVGSGGGDRSSHHDGAASPTLELQASSSRRGFIAPVRVFNVEIWCGKILYVHYLHNTCNLAFLWNILPLHV